MDVTIPPYVHHIAAVSNASGRSAGVGAVKCIDDGTLVGDTERVPRRA